MKVTQVMQLIPELSQEELFMVKIRVDYYVKNFTRIKNKAIKRNRTSDEKLRTQLLPLQR